MTTISIVECPRDAWQGFHDFIPTSEKIKHLKNLMQCGFHTIDAGSFVSPRAMPQMADAHELFAALEESREKSDSKLLSIVASEGGARRAAEFSHIDSWGYPFSVSETFQERNSRKTIVDAIEDLKRVKDLALKSNVELVVYLSMAFGNPYGEAYHTDLVLERLEEALV
jgi:hydroxymethylglutaryl-CoA lyase